MLTKDPSSITKALVIPKSEDFGKYIMEHIKSISLSNNYSSFLLTLLRATLDPNPEKRLNVESLMQLFTARSNSDKLGEEYNIVNKVSEDSLVILQESRKRISRVRHTLGDISNNQEDFSVYLISHKNTAKKYNAFCATFQNENDAVQYYEDSKKIQGISHNNLVPYLQSFMQRDNFTRFRVYILKVRTYVDSYFEAYLYSCLMYIIGEIL